MSIDEVLSSKNIHFEGVSLEKKQGSRNFFISDDQGYVIYVTSVASTFLEAKNKALEMIEKIHIPKMFYRVDIGDKSYSKLKMVY